MWCEQKGRGTRPATVYATTVPVAPDRADLKEKGPALRGPFDVTSRLRAQRRLPQKRWMRLQASSRSEVLVAYEMRNAGPRPNAEPCTTATPSFSKSSVTKSSSLAITLPDGEVLPMVPAQDG